MTCERVGCDKDVEQPATGARRRFCSKECWGAVNTGAALDRRDVEETAPREPEAPIPYEQLPIGLCEGCGARRWLYRRAGDAAAICGVCVLGSGPFTRDRATV